MGEQNTHRRRYKVWSRVFRKEHPDTTPPRNPSHIQLQNPDTTVDAHKCLLTGARYRCHLEGTASTWKIQRGNLSASHWTEHRVPNGWDRERTKGVEAVCNTIGGTTTWVKKYSQRSQGQNHQPKSTHGPRHTGSRGWSCWTPNGVESFGPGKTWYLNVEEY